jgi:opacity protein-like surface antigen
MLWLALATVYIDNLQNFASEDAVLCQNCDACETIGEVYPSVAHSVRSTGYPRFAHGDALRILPRFGFAWFCLPLACLLAFASPTRSSAQAGYTASRAAGISAFGGYINGNPEYGSARDSGEAIGADFTKYLRLPITVSLEGRFNFLSGTYVSEHTKLVGFTVGSESLKRFHMHPYADFLIGDGTIKFNTTATGYTSDDSTVYDFGGGLDIDLVHNFQLRGDYQYQHWKLGQATAPFTPNLFLIGVNYQFHFRDYNRQSDR